MPAALTCPGQAFEPSSNLHSSATDMADLAGDRRQHSKRGNDHVFLGTPAHPQPSVTRVSTSPTRLPFLTHGSLRSPRKHPLADYSLRHKKCLQSGVENAVSVTSSLRMTQAKNVVLQVSEMEAKVQEATNDEPW